MNSTRQLAAILFADIQGYTSLMQKDEAAAAGILKRFQSELEKRTAEYHGRIVNFYGDGALGIFQNPLEAVRCAMALQLAFQQAPHVPVRMGLHMGTVVSEEDKIFGDPVNLASRIESMGIPGAILFSRIIRNEIKNQPDINITSLGSFTFKNVEEPMEVFALANEGFAVPKPNQLGGKVNPGKTAAIPRWLIPALIVVFVAMIGIYYVINTSESLPVTDKSIAVLPFDNLNGDSSRQYLSDGISQDILTNLSGIKDLLVISFNSSKQFRSSDKSSRDIGKALGVRHLLSGSVQENGEQLRIRAMLINAETDQQLWAHSYDIDRKDIFHVQSEVSKKIADVLKAELLPEVAARINEKPTENMTAYQEYAQGRYLFEQRGMTNLWAAEKHFQKAIQLDSGFAEAYAGLAQMYTVIGTNDRSYLSKSKILADKAIALDPALGDAFLALGSYYHAMREDYYDAISNYQKALELDPGNATAYQWYAEALVSKGDISEGRAMIEIAKKLDPGSRIIKLMSTCILLAEDNYAQAKAELEAFYRQSPEVRPISFILALYYSKFGAYEKAMTIQSPENKSWDIIDKVYIEIENYRDQKQLAELQKLKTRIAQTYTGSTKEKLEYATESEILWLQGDTTRYFDRLDSALFILGYRQPIHLQYFPPADAIRSHPTFQEMMQKRGFYVRRQSEQLKKKEL